MAPWGDALADAEKLTPHAVSTRYSIADLPVSEAECRIAVEIAARVLEEVSGALHGMPEGRGEPKPVQPSAANEADEPAMELPRFGGQVSAFGHS